MPFITERLFFSNKAIKIFYFFVQLFKKTNKKDILKSYLKNFIYYLFMPKKSPKFNIY